MSESWRITTMLLTVLLISSALAWYVVRRARWAFALPRSVTRALGVVCALGLVAATLSRSLGIEYAGAAAALGAFGGAVMLSIAISSVLLIPVEVGRGIAKLVSTLTTRADGAPKGESAASPESPPRRAFIAQAAAGGALTLGVGSSVYGTVFGRRDYTVETIPVRLEKLPAALSGLTIVQLSDLHVGTFVGERELAAAISLVRDAKADVVVLTGDLLDHDVSYAPVLSRFARSLQGLARYGVFAVPGNHDHYAGAREVLRGLREADCKVLLNRHVRIGQPGAQLVLAGLDDVAGPRFGSPGPLLDEAFAGAPDQLARVLLSHNPAFFPTSHKQSDLTLSGHTHGGQVTLFINPAELVLRHGLVRGLYTVEGSQLYVNRGFGTAGPPTRIGSPPEVTRLVLHG